MKKLFKQSIKHWLMAVITLFLTFDERIGLTLIGTIIFSLIIGLLVECYQFIKEKLVKGKTLTKEYYIASAFDVIVTVAGGVLGFYFVKLVKLIKLILKL